MEIKKLGYTLSSPYTDEEIKNLFIKEENILQELTLDYQDRVFHYFPSGKIFNILEESQLLFSDIEFLNDSQEGLNIFTFLKCLIENGEISEIDLSLSKKLCDFERILSFMDNEIVYGKECRFENDLRKDGFIYNSRKYVLCTSKNPDCLAMWKYYSKGSAYDALNIGFHPEALVEDLTYNLQQLMDTGVLKITHGSVIYDDSLKKNILIRLVRELDKVYKKYVTENKNTTDYFSKKQYEMLDRFFYLLKDFSIFFKNEAYGHEQEYRFVIEMDSTYIKNNDVNYGFRKTDTCLVPYIKLRFDKKIIEDLVISPTDSNNQALIRSVRAFLDFYGYEHTDLCASTIPLRY